jgi:peroxiredoxin
MLSAGDSVTPFTLRSHDGESISLDGLKGSWVVLHSFPFAFTGG